MTAVRCSLPILVVASLVVVACSSSSDDAAPTTTDAPPVDADDTTAAGDEEASGESAEPPVDEPVDDEVATTTTDAPVVTLTGPGGIAVAPAAWGPCDDLAGLECATVSAPLDYDDPDGAQIELAVARRAASDPDGRIGSLLINPGGPGGSGLGYLELAVLAFPEEVAAVFDLVSFDPRGVGDSSSVDCDLRRDDGVDLVGDDDRAAWDAIAERVANELATCTFGVDGLASHLGTNNAARDLDVLRAAVGDEQLTYLGFSYGTRLGATYAELFPDRVRALVLDGAVKPSGDFSDLGRTQSAGFDRALGNFAAACDADADCLLQEIGPTLDVLAAVREEIREVGGFDAGPGRTLTPGELDLGVIASLYSKDSWPILAQALYLAETTADGELFQVLTDSYAGRRPDGSYTNQIEAQSFINCADDVRRPTLDEAWAEADSVGDDGVYFGELLRSGSGCSGLPEAIDPLLIGPAEGAPPLLVIGTTGDPATPYEWSVEMAAVLSSGVLFTVEGEGHTAYTSIECVTSTVNAYLIDLVVPVDGASCADDVGSDFFVPAGESELEQVVAFFACLRDEGLEIDEVTVADLLADPTGEAIFSQIDLDDLAVGQAFLACQELLPL